MLCFGLLVLVFWFFLTLTSDVFRVRLPHLSTLAQELGPVALLIGLAFSALGAVCEIFFNLIFWGKVRKSEGILLRDLCGRSRFDRSRKNYKLVRREDHDWPDEL
jgi:Ca2+/Na+ antiporter